jgi:hypothetical protein
MRGIAAGPPLPEKRRGSPGRLPLATLSTIATPPYTLKPADLQRAVRLLVRRHCVRTVVAEIIAAELGVGR